MFPNGITHYILGGVLIGLALAGIYLITGIQAGASGWFSAIWSKWTKTGYESSLKWRTIFTLMTILGGFIYAITFGQFYITTISWTALFVGGLFAGIGTRLALGCTSGHGICGISALHKSSIVFIIVLILTGMLTRILLGALL